MKLREAKVRNFRSLKDVQVRFQDDLTILIGENDSGKSSVLDALQLFLSAVEARRPEPPPDSDFHVDPVTKVAADEIEIELTFVDPPSNEYRVRGIFRRAEGPRFEEHKPDAELEGLPEKELNSLLRKMGLDPAGFPTASDKLEAVRRHGGDGARGGAWVPVEAREVRERDLPAIERYLARDYQRPEQIAIKTLRAIYADSLTTDTRLHETATSLENRIKQLIDSRLTRLKDLATQYVQGCEDISFEPELDFSKAFADGQFLVDRGHGRHPLSGVGDGTKRRLLMAVLEWDRDFRRQRREIRPLILAYDEPDTSLDFGAQRTFFKLLSGLAAERPDIQIILCTHSVPMVDCAPLTKLILLCLERGVTKVIQPVSEGDLSDEELSQFLDDVAARVGLTNSALLFERCYLLVEGETESACLPILYRRLYRRSMREDGIVLICLSGCGNTLGIWRLLGKDWKQDRVVTLLDKDAEARYADRRVGQLFTVGSKEFEDAFPDRVWAYVLNEIPEWQRVDGQPWSEEHIAGLRKLDSGPKFSAKLATQIQQASQCEVIKKPRLGEELGRRLKLDDIPSPILQAFERARMIAGVG